MLVPRWLCSSLPRLFQKVRQSLCCLMHHAREASCGCKGTPRSSFDQTVAAHEDSVRLLSVFSSIGSVRTLHRASPEAASKAWTFSSTNTNGTILRSCPGISKMKDEAKRDQRKLGERVPM